MIIVKDTLKQSDTRSNFISEKFEIGFVVYVGWSLSFKKCCIVQLYMCDRQKLRHKCNNRWFQGDDIKLQYLCSIVCKVYERRCAFDFFNVPTLKMSINYETFMKFYQIYGNSGTSVANQHSNRRLSHIYSLKFIQIKSTSLLRHGTYSVPQWCS